ncbi:MAG: type IV pilin protein [Xanthomonadaceae bacterium]|nr:type IV pilin protein [Xanthomonadaceae bacterium]
MKRILRARGFTLIELLIVVAIVAVLVAIAIPSYREQVIKTRRAEGKAELAEVAQRLERCFTRFNAYNSAECAATAAGTSENGWYQVRATAITATSFTLAATPQGDQAASDLRCGVLSLTHTGVRTQSLTPPAGYRCW